MSYNPVPPRVWSRVENRCESIDPLLYKGNVLQHRQNRATFTRAQRYARLAQGFGTKTHATQSQTYTNPNTHGWVRANYVTYPYPNNLVGAPNNPAGPFVSPVLNPQRCPSLTIQDGGNLVYGVRYADPCLGTVADSPCSSRSALTFHPASASDVPGNVLLAWDARITPWFPKPRYIMNNSTDKWPVNYKGFRTAIDPSGCIF